MSISDRPCAHPRRISEDILDLETVGLGDAPGGADGGFAGAAQRRPFGCLDQALNAQSIPSDPRIVPAPKLIATASARTPANSERSASVAPTRPTSGWIF